MRPPSNRMTATSVNLWGGRRRAAPGKETPCVIAIVPCRPRRQPSGRPPPCWARSPTASAGSASSRQLFPTVHLPARRLPARGHRDRRAAVRLLRLPRRRLDLPGQPGHRPGRRSSAGARAPPSLGMKIDAKARLFVAGAAGGDGRVVNAGHRRHPGQLSTSPTRPTRSSTTSCSPRPRPGSPTRTNPVLYGLPLGRNGELPAERRRHPAADRRHRARATGATNANGIVPYAGRPGAADRAVQHRPAVPGRPAHRRHHAGRPRRRDRSPTATACCCEGRHALRRAEPAEPRSRSSELNRAGTAGRLVRRR